ncbi:hypothetical protein PPL_00197 [Heterostelium album PN500]|uniref:Uncharacterized protein n=1 Tax=Heterostelium pallidum (strain ATCC 26659 / Pp 5 / PN500) TaxID=670386 RepID=D3AVT2_HETP5|nr:hypothetical protein PPL_00197 [Heterostelium album PN500]EFA86405.1 hypothetical protein PPL_00197 [Heterostelium album PN500]|eukprot:XP_020438510.1 hypothetical protein PPL_00197 [Heterostelium album PN500]
MVSFKSILILVIIISFLYVEAGLITLSGSGDENNNHNHDGGSGLLTIGNDGLLTLGNNGGRSGQYNYPGHGGRGENYYNSLNQILICREDCRRQYSKCLNVFVSSICAQTIVKCIQNCVNP